jgi:hypothetical protein
MCGTEHSLSTSHDSLFCPFSWGSLARVLVDTTVRRERRGELCCLTVWFYVCWRWALQHMLVCVFRKALWTVTAGQFSGLLPNGVVQNEGSELNWTFVSNVNITNIVLIVMILDYCPSLDIPLYIQCSSPLPCSQTNIHTYIRLYVYTHSYKQI